jgi:hypothetical protein
MLGAEEAAGHVHVPDAAERVASERLDRDVGALEDAGRLHEGVQPAGGPADHVEAGLHRSLVGDIDGDESGADGRRGGLPLGGVDVGHDDLRPALGAQLGRGPADAGGPADDGDDLPRQAHEAVQAT